MEKIVVLLLRKKNVSLVSSTFVAVWLVHIASLLLIKNPQQLLAFGPTTRQPFVRKYGHYNTLHSLHSFFGSNKVDSSSFTKQRTPAGVQDTVNVVLPPPYVNNGSSGSYEVGTFRNTTIGQVSVVSMNLLAPFYHVLGLTTADEEDDEDSNDEATWQKQQEKRNNFLKQDRSERMPMAIRMAKQANGDILCLQEIEGHCRGVKTNFADSTASARHPGKPTANLGLNHQIEDWLARDEVYEIPAVSENVNGASNTETKTKTITVKGYDSYVWTPLMPNNRRGDIVGLCIAWRSNRHTLLQWEGYKRGMACQFQEYTFNVMAESNSMTETCSDASIFAIANLHLPARPSNILGRLKTMSRTIQKLAELDSCRPSHSTVIPLRNFATNATIMKNHIDGLVIVAGDFNSDHNSVAAQLLKRGSLPYGNLRERNYKGKVTKATALEMRHVYRFQDVYDCLSSTNEKGSTTVRQSHAPLTVSLRGRGPGCMDHLFFAVASSLYKRKGLMKPERNDESILASRLSFTNGKRRARRKKSETQQKKFLFKNENCPFVSSSIKVDAVLATMRGIDDIDRLKIVLEGLPNAAKGYPSDHLPVGALFKGGVQNGHYPTIKPAKAEIKERRHKEFGIISVAEPSPRSNGVSKAVLVRRQTSRVSVGFRRRHNAVLNLVTDWLVGRGVCSIVRDQPLYKNDLVTKFGGQQLNRKSRAPDLMGIVVKSKGVRRDCTTTLVIVEVAIAACPDRVRKQKIDKYSDIVKMFSSSEDIRNSETFNCRLFTLVFHENGNVPEDTKIDLQGLRLLTETLFDPVDRQADTDIEELCSHLKAIVCSFQNN